MTKSINYLIGKKITRIKGMETDSSKMTIYFSDNKRCEFMVAESCCAEAYIEDINGKIENLLGQELTQFDIKMSNNPNVDESGTYTFYTIGTKDG